VTLFEINKIFVQCLKNIVLSFLEQVDATLHLSHTKHWDDDQSSLSAFTGIH
jgi:hypothetical protein